MNISAKANSLNTNPNRIILKMTKGMALPSSIKDIHGVKKVKHFFGQNYVLYTNGNESIINIIRSYESVDRADFDTFANREALPTPTNVEKVPRTLEKSRGELLNDPKLSRLWAFKDSDDNGMSVLKTYKEFGTVKNQEPIIVAVVDTGVDYNHEDLRDIMWVNTGEIPGNGIDDDGNGYVDDIHGINTLIRDSEGNATGDMMDDHSHGTHVSGTIAATQNNGIGIAGVASNVRIMGIRSVPSRGDETDVDGPKAQPI